MVSIRGMMGLSSNLLIVLFLEGGCNETSCLGSCCLDISAMMDCTFEMKGRTNSLSIHCFYWSTVSLKQENKLR